MCKQDRLWYIVISQNGNCDTNPQAVEQNQVLCSVSISRKWSTLSNAFDKSIKTEAQCTILSIQEKKSFTTNVTAEMVLWSETRLMRTQNKNILNIINWLLTSDSSIFARQESWILVNNKIIVVSSSGRRNHISGLPESWSYNSWNGRLNMCYFFSNKWSDKLYKNKKDQTYLLQSETHF